MCCRQPSGGSQAAEDHPSSHTLSIVLCSAIEQISGFTKLVSQQTEPKFLPSSSATRVLAVRGTRRKDRDKVEFLSSSIPYDPSTYTSECVSLLITYFPLTCIIASFVAIFSSAFFTIIVLLNRMRYYFIGFKKHF